MKKNIYRAKNVKSLNLIKLAEAVQDKRIIVGHDVAKTKAYAVLMDAADGTVLVTMKWKQPHDMDLVLDILESLPVSSLECAMESSGTYGDSFRYQLKKRQIPVYRVSAKHSADSHELYDGVPSAHDAKSSAVIADLHRWGKSQEWKERSEVQKSRQALVKLMRLHDETYYRLLNMLEAYLSRHWPELLDTLSLTSISLVELVAAFGCAQAVAASPHEAEQLLRRVSRGTLRGQKRTAVVQSASTTNGLPPCDEECELMKQVAGEARRARTRARAIKRKIEKMAANDDAISAMAPVVGKVTATVLVAAVGDPGTYGSANAYLKSMGLNLKEKSSGQYKGRLKITKRGPGETRRYLFLAAVRFIQQDRLTRMWFQAKVIRDGGLKIKALIAVVRKLVKALWHVRQGYPFDSSLLFDYARLYKRQKQLQALCD